MNRSINYQHFPSPDQVWAWQTAMQDVGPRLTGSEGHQRLINYWAEELTRLGLQVHRDTYHLRHRWEGRVWGLWAPVVDGAVEQIPVTAYYPYSGQTPAHGITAELIYCPQGAADFARAAGKIAIIDVNAGEVPTAFLFTPRADQTVPDKYAVPVSPFRFRPHVSFA